MKWMRFFTKSEILSNFSRKSGFDTCLSIIELEVLGPKYPSDTIRDGKNTHEFYSKLFKLMTIFEKFPRSGSFRNTQLEFWPQLHV